MTAYARPESIVETEWVYEHLDDPSVRLVEVDVDTNVFDHGHISGAVGWNWQSQLQQGMVRDLIDKEGMQKLLSDSGISNSTTVILYGDNNNWFACWAFWQLKYYGHQDVRIMNGGRIKWELEGKPFVETKTEVDSVPYLAKEPDESLRAYRDQILKALSESGISLVDVRSPDEYSGLLFAPENVPQEGSQRAGHIPGAKNIPWAQATDSDGTFKTYAELLQLYKDNGITGEGNTVTYCRIGERSSHTWFVLTQLLGYSNVSNYDGSWTEWGSIVGAPIEK
ncbi:MAG: sulfurtransferase [SAR202 cluster bacterium]|jgi:thiosulfate/3-mercaptopyruvate sulfurtransferase|nr:MAG: sulfurtransferase [SAR202 cluster bacterium]|tara:strand:- start:115 stop:957 length:843 start_codon:yes stop_codon:yes gene_type:complete